MHTSSLNRMKWFVDNYLVNQIQQADEQRLYILDVGSCNVNGSYKVFFPPNKFIYTGLDMAEGQNVDIVPNNPYVWDKVKSNFYDVVISGQAFEHIEFFWITILEMVRVLKPGGLLCLIAPRGFGRHRYPVDCYRFDVDGMIAIARWANLHILHASTDASPEGTQDVWHHQGKEDSLLIATKPYDWHGVVDVNNYKFSIPDISRTCYPLK